MGGGAGVAACNDHAADGRSRHHYGIQCHDLGAHRVVGECVEWWLLDPGKEMMMKRFSIATMFLVLVPAAASAQIPGINLNLGARAGMFSPRSTLAETTFGDLKLKSGLGVGASLELDLPLSPINVRANLDAALGAKVMLDDVEGDEDVDVIAITGDLVFRPLPRIVVFQPYLLAGAGIKKYSFESDPDFPDDDLDESDFTGHIGLG